MRVRAYVDAHYDPSWTHRFTALVVDQDVLFGLARMYDLLTEHVPTELRILRDVDEARTWLDARARGQSAIATAALG